MFKIESYETSDLSPEIFEPERLSERFSELFVAPSAEVRRLEFVHMDNLQRKFS